MPACPTHCSCLLPFVHSFFSRQIDFQLFAWQFAAQLVAACCYCASSRITTVSVVCSSPLSCTPTPSASTPFAHIYTHLVGKVAQVLDILRLVIVLDLLVRYDALVIDLPDQPIDGAWHHALDQLASAACSTVRSCGCRQGAKCLLQLRQLRLIDGARLQRRHVNQLRIPVQLIRQRQVTFLWGRGRGK